LAAEQWQRDCAGEKNHRPETAESDQGRSTINLRRDGINRQDQSAAPD